MKTSLIKIILFSLYSFLLYSCVNKRADLSKIDKEAWYVSSEMGIALKFNETENEIKGNYIFITNATSKLYSFNANWKWSKIEFTFLSHSELSLKGYLQIKKNEIQITIENGKILNFTKQPIYRTHKHLRYKDEVFTKVSVAEIEYGRASGFYTSKKISKYSEDNYPDIIMDIIEGLSDNLLCDEVPLLLDVYTPMNDTVKNRPLILLIHGGAFVAGDKRDNYQVRLAEHYARCGYVVASINYRMGFVFIPGLYSNFERCIYKSVQDTRAALRFLSENKNKYGIDPNLFFIAGNSAGGFISLYTTFMEESEKWESTAGNIFLLQKDLGCLDCSSNNYKAQYSIAGVINLWGAISELNIIDEYEKVPVMLIHGDKDKIVPYTFNYPFANINEDISAAFTQKVYGSKPIFDKMISMSYDVNLVTIEGGGHEPFENQDLSYNMYYRQIEDHIGNFMFRILSEDEIKIEGQTEIIPTKQAVTYSTNNFTFNNIKWYCQGGVIIQQTNNEAKVIWIENDDNKCIIVSSENSIGLINVSILQVIIK